MNSRKVAVWFLIANGLFLDLCGFVSADDCVGDVTVRRGTKNLSSFNCSAIYGSVKILYTTTEDFKNIRFPNLR